MCIGRFDELWIMAKWTAKNTARCENNDYEFSRIIKKGEFFK